MSKQVWYDEDIKGATYDDSFGGIQLSTREANWINLTREDLMIMVGIIDDEEKGVPES